MDYCIIISVISGDNDEEDLYEKQLRISQEKKRKKKKKTKGKCFVSQNFSKTTIHIHVFKFTFEFSQQTPLLTIIIYDLGIEVSTEDPTLMDEDEEKRGITYKIMKNKVSVM